MRTLVVAPHPDHEVLGVGGTLLRRKSEGASIAWLIVTKMTPGNNFSEDKISSRHMEISRIGKFFEFDEIYNLGLPTAGLDVVPMAEVVHQISEVMKEYRPDEIFTPHLGDIHTDHGVVFNAAVSCSKWFRNPSITRIMSYETISETDFGLDHSRQFHPNVFVDISDFLEKKLTAMEIYSSELGEFPFPRSRLAMESLARYRGSSSGFKAAEAFQLLRERS